ncbi:EPIDERMAL PATTERNING FACTOR-like protein 8 [Vitis riparia]|uniref:EPIDERMAL PATTERNING FACTOR-like protein 8 n=1 Tax=Vitis riparia TaxID=96939 RepID=UPI00155A1811|nr:EPIDERMAL PATTERNING FACTOR-like protein 8 [Vitis riparia]
MLMASSTTHPHGLKAAVIAVILISFLTSLLPFKSAGSEVSSYSESLQQRKKMVLGSKPPRCVNKCLNCRPCMATLVIPPRQKKVVGASSHGEDDNYYLLSWKCRCGDKLFQP